MAIIYYLCYYVFICYYNMVSVVVVYHMKETGWEKISQDDTVKLHYQYQDEKLGKGH